jgi:hypothetical protein
MISSTGVPSTPFSLKSKALLRIRVTVVIRLQNPLLRLILILGNIIYQNRTRMPDIHQKKSKEHGDCIEYVNKELVVVDISV